MTGRRRGPNAAAEAAAAARADAGGGAAAGGAGGQQARAEARPGRSRGLGRGLAALLAEMGAPPAAEAAAGGPGAASGAVPLPVGLIEPNPLQPRRDFDPEALAELAQSIRARGLLQPILVRSLSGGRYQIVAGERRWRAAQMAGLHEIPAVVRPFSDVAMFEAAIIENVQRADLNPIEEAEAYRKLAEDYGMTQADIAQAVGKSRSHIANLMRLSALPEAVKALVRGGALSLGHAKLLVGVPAAETLARETVARALSVRQLEARVRAQGNGVDAAAPDRRGQGPAGHGVPAGAGDADIRALEAELAQALGLAVALEPDRDGTGGRLTLRWRTLDQLDMLVARLQGT